MVSIGSLAKMRIFVVEPRPSADTRYHLHGFNVRVHGRLVAVCLYENMAEQERRRQVRIAWKARARGRVLEQQKG